MNTNEKANFVEKFQWQDERAQLYHDSMNSEETLSILEEAINLIDQDINLALSVFNDCIRKQAECMKRRVRTNRTDRTNEWFDHKCAVGRCFASVRESDAPALHESPAALQAGLGKSKAKGVNPDRKSGAKTSAALRLHPVMEKASGVNLEEKSGVGVPKAVRRCLQLPSGSSCGGAGAKL
jgi:hypothetical protein